MGCLCSKGASETEGNGAGRSTDSAAKKTGKRRSRGEGADCGGGDCGGGDDGGKGGGCGGSVGGGGG
ncbi:hypothetical protein SAY86_005031 [Trapa natans]|uniref:Uncharacterized protein n=1 Tax=Trapa natans TaxID=22666 RepID=A0AAN7QV41_TRANT|nr:hypothetical protein SAY86_005031 [Trapa natans]